MGLVPLEEAREKPEVLSFFLPCGDTARGQRSACRPGRKLSPDTSSASTLNLHVQPAELWDVNCSLSPPPPPVILSYSSLPYKVLPWVILALITLSWWCLTALSTPHSLLSRICLTLCGETFLSSSSWLAPKSMPCLPPWGGEWHPEPLVAILKLQHGRFQGPRLEGPSHWTCTWLRVFFFHYVSG